MHINDFLSPWIFLILPLVVVPIGLIVSIRYAIAQKRWWLFFAAGGLGATVIFALMHNPLFPILGFEAGIAYLSFLQPPFLRRLGAMLGWMAIMALAINAGPPLVSPGEDGWGWDNLEFDFFWFGPFGGLAGALMGLWLDRRRLSRR